MRISVVILSMGDRPDSLSAAIASVRRQTDAEIEVILVGNGAAVDGDADVTEVLDDNVGVSEGRNRGAARANGELILFLDDDAVLLKSDLAADAVRLFVADPRLAVVSCRIVDPATGLTARRHVPRLGRSDPVRGGEVTTFLGGASIVRAEAFEKVGGFPTSFFYAHEETDLSWRLMDLGYAIRYEPGLAVGHPRTDPSRHARSAEMSMRNRVLLARRNLPWLLAPIYPLTWALISLFRGRSMSAARAVVAGLKEGLSAPVERDPIHWGTVWRMTRLGRPPVI